MYPCNILNMGRFLEYYNISPIASPMEFLGMAFDRDENHMIATLGKNMVVVLNLRTQATIHSWTTVEKLSAKVVYDRFQQKYVGVFAQHSIRLWDENCTDVNKCKTLRFAKTIIDILNDGEETFVFYANGTCQLLETAINTRQQKYDEEEDDEENGDEASKVRKLTQLTAGHCNPIHASITKFPNGRKLLTFFEHDIDTGRLSLVRIPLYDGGEPTRYNIQRTNLSVQLVAYTVFEGSEAPTLWTLWSDERIFFMPLKDDTLECTSPGQFVAMLSIFSVNKPISVVGVACNSVAIYGANSSQDGASLLLYNTQYKIIKTQQFFKIYLSKTRLFTDRRHIYLAMAQNLSVVVFEHSDVLLADLMGKQCSNDFKTSVVMDNIDEEEIYNECLRPVLQHETKEVSNLKHVDIFNNKLKIQSANGLNEPYEDTHQFDRTLAELMRHQLEVEVYETKENSQTIHVEFMRNTKDNGFNTQQVHLIANVLERCGASEHEITEKLLTTLIAVDVLTEVGNCLRRYTNISDKGLAKTLVYLLKKLAAAKDKANKDVVEQVLDILLACEFDTNTLTFYIRRELEEENVILFLQYLYESLISTDKLTYKERPPQNAECVHFELQILRWFGILVKTHFQKLMLNKNAELMTLLVNWRQLFDKYKGDIAELETTAALLYNIVQKRKFYKEQFSKKWYTIEEISFVN